MVLCGVVVKGDDAQEQRGGIDGGLFIIQSSVYNRVTLEVFR